MVGVRVQPWRRCTRCNGLLQPVAKQPSSTGSSRRRNATTTSFSNATRCRQVYWQGHFERMQAFVRGGEGDA
ncbi:MAG: hypothetical protein H6643_11405 [Caldilineaceae bacterium]|nr:hypothetical protein [Caldilineaceae bacterium]